MNAAAANPAGPSGSSSGQQADERLPPEAIKKAEDLIRTSRLAVRTSKFPFVGLIFLVSLVQCHLLVKKFPFLGSKQAGQHEPLRKRFRSARHWFWFGVLLWPLLGLVLATWIYLT